MTRDLSAHEVLQTRPAKKHDQPTLKPRIRLAFGARHLAFGDADDIGIGASKADWLREAVAGRGRSQIQRRSAVLRYQAPNAKHRTPNAKRIQSHGYVPEALRADCRSLITDLITDH